MYVIGVDVGTTSTKAVLFDQTGKVCAKGCVEYPLLVPEPLAAEQDPIQIYHSVLRAIRTTADAGNVDPRRIGCIAFSAAMHGVIVMDHSDHPLTACITWADNRCSSWAEKIKRDFCGHEIYLRTGTPIHPMSPLVKILWLRETRPELFAKAARFISIKEYVTFRLFGRYVVDHSIASATGLFNLKKLDWDSEALAMLGIRASQLSTLVPTTYKLQGMDPGAAAEAHLLRETTCIIGASDGALSNLGVNAIDSGVAAVTIGTSGAIRTVVNQPTVDPQGRTFCYALTEKSWVIGGPVNNGGLIFRWIRDELAASETETAKRLGIDPYDVLTKIAERVPAGSNGLIFHPYMAGERAPLWNANARGSYFGLAMHHRKEHLIRAALEGVIYNLYSVLLVLEELIGRQAQSIRATGGFARSGLWRQMMADIFNRELTVPECYESSCLGAAVLGLYAIGMADSLSVVRTMVGTTHCHVPIESNCAIYSKIMPIYMAIPVKLRDEYEQIAAIQRETLA